MEGTIEFGPAQGPGGRVSQACSHCRRRKAKCDGHQPCKRCHSFGLECRYESQKATSAPAYIGSLETKVRELEGLLRRLNSASRGSSAGLERRGSSADDEDYLETMVSSPDRHEEHNGDEPAGFGGLSLLRRLNALCEHARQHLPFDSDQGPVPQSSNNDLGAAFDVAPPEIQSPFSWDAYAMLPSRDSTLQAIDVVLRTACCNLQFLDRDALVAVSDDAYQAVESGSLGPCRKELSLLFAVLALARRFDRSWSAPAQIKEDDSGTANGARYFRASRALLNPSDCRDLLSLRTLLCMIIYTQSCSMLSACYSYVCMAVAATLQMGLLDEPVKGRSPQEKDGANSLIKVLHIVDSSVGYSLGLPRTLRDIETDRLVASTDGHKFDSDTDAHAQLMCILADIVETNHPPCKRIPRRNGFYGVRYSDIVKAENNLTAWFECLDRSFPFDREAAHTDNQDLLRCQLLLRVYYAHVQSALYRPFLHHLLKRSPDGDELSLKAYACGDACIKAAIQVVWLIEKMEANDVLNTAHWYLNIIIAHTAACLVLFATSQSHSPMLQETRTAARGLKDICTRYAEQENSILQCLTFLEAYFPGEPRMEYANLDELQQGFDPHLSLFSSTFDDFDDMDDMTLDDMGAMNAQDDSMQALALPGFQSFVHSNF